jgi:hypothetical protein
MVAAFITNPFMPVGDVEACRYGMQGAAQVYVLPASTNTDTNQHPHTKCCSAIEW